MYKKIFVFPESKKINAINRISDNASIPFEPANTDYQQFKKDILEGAELQDANGNVMTPDEAMTFISNLP